jgi:hypothetical protein
MASVMCLCNWIVHIAGFAMRYTTEYPSLCNTQYIGEVTVTVRWLLVSICAVGWSKYSMLLTYCTEHVQQQTFKICSLLLLLLLLLKRI